MNNEKSLQGMFTSYAGWYFIQNYEDVAIWQTPTQWLACIPYLKIFKFAKDPSTAFRAVQDQLAYNSK